MVLKTEHDGVAYAWIEKGARACLIADDSRLVWWGDPRDPSTLRGVAPLAVLLELSVLRNRPAEP